MKSVRISSSVEGAAVCDLISANLVAIQRLSGSRYILAAHTPASKNAVLCRLDTTCLTLNRASAEHGLPEGLQIATKIETLADDVFPVNGEFEEVVRLRTSDAQLVHLNRAACLGALYVAHGLRLCLTSDAGDLEQGRDFVFTQNCLLDLPTKPIDLVEAKGFNATLREIEAVGTAETGTMIKGSQWVFDEFWSSLTFSDTSRAYDGSGERRARHF